MLAAGPIIQAAGIPFITAGATSPLLPDQVGDLFFMACFGDNVQAAAAAEYAYANFGDTAYLLTDEGVEYTTLLASYFKSRFEELGGTIVLEDTYADDATDFSVADHQAARAAPISRTSTSSRRCLTTSVRSCCKCARRGWTVRLSAVTATTRPTSSASPATAPTTSSSPPTR